MNDTSIKNFCIWARNELRDQVRQRLIEWHISEDTELDLAVVGARPLSTNERGQRRELMTLIKDLGEEGLVERAAYTWFNRFMAIRYMEVNGFLPSGARFLSDAEGEFRPQVIADASSTGIEGIDEQTVFELIQNADDEELFRYLFLAQCNELATCMPDVFEPIGSAMELLLPKGLLRQGSVIERMVTDIPEDAWCEGVQIVGWMYQYYNAERKDEVFASFKKGKKADAASLAPATQLFTPDWIVRYLVENSLGRLWMRGHPDSKLVNQMTYYIPDEPSVISTGGVQRRSGEISPLTPESITVVDPACGSGHILVYAFDLLAAIYEEAGYVPREIPQLILQKNLTGIEIDPRAGAMASFMLTMKGCERDSRFLSRGVYPNIAVLVPVHMEEEELALVPDLAERAKLLDAMEHADECGSLFVPDETDMMAVDGALDKLRESDGLFAGSACEKLERMKANCAPLARTYDVVVANPPYMGSSNMDKWLADWTKRNYPDSKRDLCTCFIERGFTLANPQGYSATVTSSTWMFISSFETLRKKLLESGTIISMLHTQGPNNHPDVFDANAAMIIEHAIRPGYAGSYFKLSKLGLPVKEKMLKEAIANPACGWSYRRDASSFSAIPGTPIAYWASDAMIEAFSSQHRVGTVGTLKTGMKSGNNDLFYRRWWEVSHKKVTFDLKNIDSAQAQNVHWLPCNGGGEFRRWFGNRYSIIDWRDGGHSYRSYSENGVQKSAPKNLEWSLKSCVTWNLITSGLAAFRYVPSGSMFDQAGNMAFFDADGQMYNLALLNSTVAQQYITLCNPTLNCPPGAVSELPVKDCSKRQRVLKIAESLVYESKLDWDSQEISWEYSSNPLTRGVAR